MTVDDFKIFLMFLFGSSLIFTNYCTLNSALENKNRFSIILNTGALFLVNFIGGSLAFFAKNFPIKNFQFLLIFSIFMILISLVLGLILSYSNENEFFSKSREFTFNFINYLVGFIIFNSTFTYLQSFLFIIATSLSYLLVSFLVHRLKIDLFVKTHSRIFFVEVILIIIIFTVGFIFSTVNFIL